MDRSDESNAPRDAVVTTLESPPMDDTKLAALEAEVDQHLRVVVREWDKAAQALRTIHNYHGYRQRGFKTFEEYCRVRFKIDRRRGYELMAALGVIENLAGDETVRTRPDINSAPTFSNAVAVSALPPAEQRTLAAQVDLSTAPARQVQGIVRQRTTPQAVPRPTPRSEPRPPDTSDQAANHEDRATPTADEKSTPIAERAVRSGWNLFLDFMSHCESADAKRLGQAAVQQHVSGRLHRLRAFIDAADDEARRSGV